MYCKTILTQRALINEHSDSKQYQRAAVYEVVLKKTSSITDVESAGTHNVRLLVECSYHTCGQALTVVWLICVSLLSKLFDIPVNLQEGEGAKPPIGEGI